MGWLSWFELGYIGLGAAVVCKAESGRVEEVELGWVVQDCVMDEDECGSTE